MKINQYKAKYKTSKLQKVSPKFNQEDIEEYPTSNELGYFVQSNSMSNYTVPIDTNIGDPSMYRGVLQMLLNADEQDTVTFMINSNGGLLSGLLTLLEGINMTEANTVAVIVGSADSAASMFALHCNEIYVSDNASMLAHGIQYNTGGKGSDILAHVQHISGTTRKLIKKTYKHFLSEQEIEDMLNGKEIYMDAEEIVGRLEQRQELREAEYLASQEQAPETPLEPVLEAPVVPPKTKPKKA
jgi:ATP-dependent protease ClpP protease subunit